MNINSQKINSDSAENTAQIAVELAKKFTKKGGIILFEGELGAGKTFFTQSFMKYFQITEKVNSPTFLLQKQYSIPNSDRIIFHLDLYRLSEPVDLQSTGITELFDQIASNIVLIEWSEKISKKDLPVSFTKVSIEKSGIEKRIITITEY